MADAFEGHELDKINQHVKDIDMWQADVLKDGASIKQLFARNCKSGWMYTTPENEWLFTKVIDLMTRVNDRTFQFEIDHIEPLQYLEYGFGHYYNKHVDNGDAGVATRKLTMIIQLSHSNEYIGGKTSIDSMSSTRHAPRGRGSVAIFPSHLPHKAHPVWYGKRKVLVAWMRGKKPLS